jgi:hypothetical protein
MRLTRLQTVIAALVAAVVVAGGVVTVVMARPEPDTLCVLEDVTNPALADIYTTELRGAVRRAAAAVQDVKAFPFAGAPRTESVPELMKLHALEADEQRAEIRRKLRKLEEQALDLQAERGKRGAGSGVLDALGKAVEGTKCDAGVIAYTDGLERRAFDVYRADYVSQKGRAKLIDDLKAAGLIPDLKGINVAMPYGGVVPSGSKLAEDPRRVAALGELYEAIVEAGGGHLTWGT